VTDATLVTPSFWAEWPTVWFAQAETVFSLVSISNPRTNLEHGYAAEVEDMISSPPQQDPYTILNRPLPTRELLARQIITLLSKPKLLYKNI
jgi:hypothetical protein